MAGLPRRSVGRQHAGVSLDSYGAGDEDRMRIEDMHDTVSQTKSKISNMRQALVEKNQVIRRERALRKAAERREIDKSSETTFVDMYAGSNPSVNEELKEWLSPAKQRDRTLRGGKPHPKEKDLQERMKDTERQPNEGQGVDEMDGLRDDHSITSADDIQSAGSERSPGRHGQRARKIRKTRVSDDYFEDGRPRWNPNFTMPAALGSWYSPGLVPASPWLSPHRLVPCPPDPGYWHMAGPGYGQYAHSEPNLARGPPPVRRHSDVGIHATGVDGVDSKETLTETKETTKASPATATNPTPEPQSTSTPIRVVVERGTSARTDFEEGVPMLLSELGSTKDVNKELQERLLETEQEIESLRLSQSLTEATLEAQVAARAAAVVEEIYAAQKERDEAIMGRLRLANQERDESIARLRRMEVTEDFDSGTDVEDEFGSTDVNMNDLLLRLSASDTGPEIAKYGRSILGQINKVKSSKGRIVAEEMQAIIKERDIAQAKCKKLEREAIDLRRTVGGLSSQIDTEEALQIQLEATRQERDTALANVRKIQEELEDFKMQYSLHKSLSQEAELCDGYNTMIGGMAEHVNASDRVLAETQQINSQLTSQLTQLHDERNAMAAQLHHAQQAQMESQAKLQEKDRLIAVLRKKVAEGTVKTVN